MGMESADELSPLLAEARVRAPVGAGTAAVAVRYEDGGGRPFVLKRFSDAALGEREHRALLRAGEPFASRVIAGGALDGGYGLALAWVDGTSLDQRLGGGPPLTSREIVVVACAVASALAALHDAGLRHGDLKAANVILHSDGEGATLIDFSLTAGVGEVLTGATLAGLAPEARTDPRRVGPETDLFALGVLLGSLVAVCGARASDALLARIVAWADALSAPSPGTRPSARVVADDARRLLGRIGDQGVREERRERVRRAYLLVRAGELDAPAILEPSWRGPTRDWTATALPRGDAGGRVLGPLDLTRRAAWLARLVGGPPPDGANAFWVRASEDALAERLLGLAEAHEVLVGADLRDDANEGEPALDLVAATALLGAPRPNARVLAWSEAALAQAPPSFALSLAAALLRVGEVGRAWLALTSVVASDRTPAVHALLAELARRRGDVAGARAAAETARSGHDRDARERAGAVLARLAWDAGAYDEAERELGELTGARVAEVRGLIAYARGELERGIAIVTDALAAVDTSEDRARLEGTRGMLEHARGDATASLRAFQRAVDFAGSASVIDEATYLTGLAAAAVDAGEGSIGLEASLRAALLWDRLDRPDRAARAWLSRGAAFALFGAWSEAREAASEARRRIALGVNDPAAEAYAWLIDVESVDLDRVSRRAALSAAVAAAARAGGEVSLRVRARALTMAGATLSSAEIASGDEEARAASPSARLEWWGARAAHALDAMAQGAPLASDEARAIVRAVSGALAERTPAASRAMAIPSAAGLARSVDDGEAALRFETERRRLAESLRASAPPALRARMLATPLFDGGDDATRLGTASSLDPAQIASLESLVRSLGARDRLGPLLNQVLDALLLWTGVERGLLLLRAPDGSLVARAARNLARADLDDEQRALSHGIARKALELGDVVVATDAFASLGELHASVHALRLRSVLAVPLIARGEALGVVYLDDRLRRGAFGAREVGWVRLLATHAALAVADARDAVRLRRAVRHAERANHRLARELAAREIELTHVKAVLDNEAEAVRYQGLAGKSEAMKRTLHMVSRVAASDVPVLLVGESGTGKELLARAIHDSGARRKKPFVTENCGAVPEPLLESILFGHKKGAFTGATSSRPGLFEIADGGTLLLDEIGEMSPAMQAKLLRVLQDGEVRAVGGEATRRVNVRVVAATHRDLSAMVKSGAFREDLFYRLNVVRVEVPALRERAEDIPELVAFLVRKHAGERTIRVTRAAMDRLVSYPWPGNVRQLENEVRRALVLAGDRIDASELSPEILQGSAQKRTAGTDLRSRLDALEAELVMEALEKTRGNQTKAAELLGVSRFGLQKMIKRLGVRLPA